MLVAQPPFDLLNALAGFYGGGTRYGAPDGVFAGDPGTPGALGRTEMRRTIHGIAIIPPGLCPLILRFVALSSDGLRNRCRGDWIDRGGNSNIAEELLSAGMDRFGMVARAGIEPATRGFSEGTWEIPKGIIVVKSATYGACQLWRTVELGSKNGLLRYVYGTARHWSAIKKKVKLPGFVLADIERRAEELGSAYRKGLRQRFLKGKLTEPATTRSVSGRTRLKQK